MTTTKAYERTRAIADIILAERQRQSVSWSHLGAAAGITGPTARRTLDTAGMTLTVSRLYCFCKALDLKFSDVIGRAERQVAH